MRTKNPKSIPITLYIAFNRPKQGQELLEKYGMKRAKSVRDLANRLDVLLLKKKEEALKDFALLHPDRDLILAYQNDNDEQESKSSCCGSGADGSTCNCNKGRNSSVEGDAKTPTGGVMQTIKPYLPIIVGGTLLLIGVVVVLKNA
jgi:hypothetical protein